MAGATSPDNIPYMTTLDGVIDAAYTDSLAEAVQDALDGVRTTRAIQEFRWANAAARAAQTGMVLGDQGLQVDTVSRYIYTGSAWIPSGGGLTRLSPSAVSGTGASIGSTGKILVSSGGANFSIQGCFSSAFSSYRIKIPRLVGSTTSVLQVQLMNGASAISTGTYDFDLAYRTASTPNAVATSSATALNMSGASTQPVKSGWLEVDMPASAVGTAFNWKLFETPAAGASPGQVLGGGFQRDATAYDGIRFLVNAGTITSAEVVVYGYSEYQ